MHRAILLGFVFLFASAPDLHSQQVPVPLTVERSPLPVRELAPAPSTSDITSIRIEPMQTRQGEAETAAAAEPTVQTFLAIIGAVVLVAALISLFT